MNTLSPKNGNGRNIEKSYVDQIHNEIVEINQRLDVDESNISSNTEDVAYAIAKNTVQDTRLDALENKTDYTMDRLEVDIVSGNTINATTITTTNFQTDTISADNLDLNGALRVDDISSDTITTDTLTADTITIDSVNAETADFDSAEMDTANIPSLTSTNVATEDITVSDTANISNLRANKLVTTDSTLGTADLTSIKFRNETLITDLPNAFRYIKMPIIQNGYYGIEYINNAAVDDKENFSIMVYQNNGTVMVSYSQNDINTIHKFYYDSLNKNLWIETTNEIDTGIVKWSSSDTETHNLAEFYRDITIDITQKEVFGKLATRLHGWLFMGDHTVSYGMDIMGHLTADLITPDKMITPFQRFYPEGTPIEAIYKDLIGNVGIGRFETSGYYGTALNKVEALNRLKVEENKITWTIDTDYGWDNIIWENWGQTETIPYDIGVITTSNVWDRAVNDPFEPTVITLTIHNTVDGTISTSTGYGFITLTDIPESGYTLQGFATEIDGAVVYNVGDKLTEDTELWTVYQTQTTYGYTSGTDPNWNPSDPTSYYYQPSNLLVFDTPIDGLTVPEDYSNKNVILTVESDFDFTDGYYSSSLWLNGYCGIESDSVGAETCYIRKIGDNLYEFSWEVYFEFATWLDPNTPLPITSIGDLTGGTVMPNLIYATEDDTAGTYFNVRDTLRVENA